MRVFRLDKNTLTSVRPETFRSEKDIQSLVENNLESLFGLDFDRSEFPVTNFRLDTLGFDRETSSFVVIEYKKDRNFSVIDQGYTYLSLLLNNKSDFVLEYNERMDRTLRRDEIDWSQSRIIFISPHFTEYQKHSVNFKDVPFELWEITQYENGMVSLSQHRTSSNESVSTTKGQDRLVEEVTREIRVYTEDYHLQESVKSERPQWVVDLYDTFRNRVLNLGDVEIVPRKQYISFRRGRPFVDVEIRQGGLKITLNMKKGTLKDPEKITKDVSGQGHWGNGDYQFQIDRDTDLDGVMFLVKQSFLDKGDPQ